MNISPVQNLSPDAELQIDPAIGVDRFSEVLSRAARPGEPVGHSLGPRSDSQPEEPSHAELKEAVQQLVSTALVTPLLSELRDEPLDSGLFHGGFAEDAFQQRLETILADRMVRSPRFAIADRIYEALLPRFKPSLAVDTHG